MKNRIETIARELSRGNIEEASKLRFAEGYEDRSLSVEVVEVAREAMITYLKKGELAAARKVEKLFELPEDLANEAIKHAVISAYYDGDLKTMLEIEKGLPLTRELKEEIIGYCESWGRKEEAEAMRSVFFGS